MDIAERPEYLKARIGSGTEVAASDMLETASLPHPLRGVNTAYHLIHSMGSADSFEEQDRWAAQNFARAARKSGVQRVIYLGGLGEDADGLSLHGLAGLAYWYGIWPVHRLMFAGM